MVKRLTSEDGLIHDGRQRIIGVGGVLAAAALLGAGRGGGGGGVGGLVAAQGVTAPPSSPATAS
jgi:hypothetical protein